MDDLRQRIADLMPVARDELAELVALRSVADARQYPPEECERTAQWVLEKFADLGFSDAHLEETADGSMAVVGSRTCAARRALPRCCSTPTTTYSRRSTTTPGAHRRSS